MSSLSILEGRIDKDERKQFGLSMTSKFRQLQEVSKASHLLICNSDNHSAEL